MRSVAEQQRLTIFLSVAMLNEELFASTGRGAEQKALKGFCVIIPVCLIPHGSEREEDGESLKRVRMKELPVFSHTSLQILLLPKLASLGTDCHASLPSMDNQSFFEEPSMGTRPLGSHLLLANGGEKKLRSWGISLPSALAM